MNVTFSPAETLLDWYDQHHRTLPWRVAPADGKAGVRPDPYSVWLSEIMLQQTTVVTVTRYFDAFIARWPTVNDLAAAPVEDIMAAWAGLGYYSRARNLHACAKVVSGMGGFPETEAELIALPGIGPYTAAAIAAIAFDKTATVLDGNVERVMARRFAETDPLPGVKERLREHARSLTTDHRPGDYAQAVMDLGATICTPRNPACAICPWMADCEARPMGIAATLPRKTPKRAKPIRHGIVYVGFNEDRVLVDRRPDKGLLGGMLGLPTSDWGEGPPPLRPPVDAVWLTIGEVRHTFTHFNLRLNVMRATVDPTDGTFKRSDDVAKALPTVFAKALKLALKY